MAGLTAGSQGCSVWPGTRWRRRSDEDDLWRPEVKKAMMAALQGFPLLAAWRRGRGRCGGAVGLVGEARPRRWLRQLRAVATGAFRRLGEREPGEEGERERVREVRGVVATSREARAMRREAGGGRARGRGRLWRGHAAAWARGRKTTEEEAGWAAAGLHSNGLHREVSAR